MAIYFMFYNFCRIHSTFRVTPTLESGLATHAWTMEERVALLEQ
ncbi:MAG: hypothetical protein ACRD0Y_00040 [Terriglobales bacterium]